MSVLWLSATSDSHRESTFSRVLSAARKPIGYLDVPALKVKWEAGKADPVRIDLNYNLPFSALISEYVARAERTHPQAHEALYTWPQPALRIDHPMDTSGRSGNFPEEQ